MEYAVVSMTDFQYYLLERQIKLAHERLSAASTREEAYLWWDTMTELISRRSPEHVQRLETQKGLR